MSTNIIKKLLLSCCLYGLNSYAMEGEGKDQIHTPPKINSISQTNNFENSSAGLQKLFEDHIQAERLDHILFFATEGDTYTQETYNTFCALRLVNKNVKGVLEAKAINIDYQSKSGNVNIPCLMQNKIRAISHKTENKLPPTILLYPVRIFPYIKAFHISFHPGDLFLDNKSLHEVLIKLDKLPFLEELYISKYFKTSDNTIQSMPVLPSLRVFTLGNHRGTYENEALLAKSEQFPNLETVTFSKRITVDTSGTMLDLDSKDFYVFPNGFKYLMQRTNDGHVLYQAIYDDPFVEILPPLVNHQEVNGSDNSSTQTATKDGNDLKLTGIMYRYNQYHKFSKLTCLELSLFSEKGNELNEQLQILDDYELDVTPLVNIGFEEVSPNFWKYKGISSLKAEDVDREVYAFVTEHKTLRKPVIIILKKVAENLELKKFSRFVNDDDCLEQKVETYFLENSSHRYVIKDSWVHSPLKRKRKIDTIEKFLFEENFEKKLPVSTQDYKSEFFFEHGINITDAIKNLNTFQGRNLEYFIELKLKPNRSSIYGFIGKNESFLQVLATDNDFVLSQGLTHQDLAFPLLALEFLEMQYPFKSRKSKTFKWHGIEYEMRYTAYRGMQFSPFQDKFGTNKEFWVVNKENQTGFCFSGLLGHLIHAYGFYEGKGTPYRVCPEKILDTFPWIREKSNSEYITSRLRDLQEEYVKHKNWLKTPDGRKEKFLAFSGSSINNPLVKNSNSLKSVDGINANLANVKMYPFSFSTTYLKKYEFKPFLKGSYF